jgi:hypothetical protein
MDHVEGALAVEAPTHRERMREPGWVTPGKPRVVMPGVDVVPPSAIALLLEQAFGVPGRYDVDVVAGLDETLGERTRVVLHAADAVPCDRDHANPHRE